MQDTGDVPEPTIWLPREYGRRLALYGDRHLPRIRSSVEDAQTRVAEWLKKYNDPEMLDAFARFKNNEALRDLLEAETRLGAGAYLSRLSAQMEPALQRIIGSRTYPVLVDVQTANDFNASVVNTASGFLILVGNGVGYFINQCAKIAGYACPEFVKFPGEITYLPEPFVDETETPMNGLSLFLFCGISLGIQLIGYLGDAEPAALSFLLHPHPDKLNVIIDIVISAERFMIGHEHGHIANNHLLAATIADDIPIRSSNQEFEADAFAVDLLTTSEMSKARTFGSSDDEVQFDVYMTRAIGGCALFCAADLLVEAAMTELLGQEKLTPTHPSAVERWEAIKNRLSSSFSDHIGFGENLFKFFSKVAPLSAAFCAGELTGEAK
jgi:hypothetical protein